MRKVKILLSSLGSSMNQIFKQCNMKLHVYSSKGRLFKKLNLKKKSAATLTVAAAMSIISSKKGI